jgi:hypothetical protein
MSVLTAAQRAYMDAVLRGMPLPPSAGDSGDVVSRPSSLKPTDVVSSPASR